MANDVEQLIARASARARANRPDRFRRLTGERLPLLAGRAVMLGRECVVHAEHDEKVPIAAHFVRPRPRGGGECQLIALCANAHGRVHYLLDGIEAYAAACPYATPDEVLTQLPPHVWTGFTESERMIAYRGWESYGLSFLNGRYLNAFRWWSTDGKPKQPDVPHFADLLHASRWSRKWRRELNEL